MNEVPLGAARSWTSRRMTGPSTPSPRPASPCACLPNRQIPPPEGDRSSVTGEGRDGVRRCRLRRRGACRPALPAQEDQTSRERPATPFHPHVLEGPTLDLPAGKGGGA